MKKTRFLAFSLIAALGTYAPACQLVAEEATPSLNATAPETSIIEQDETEAGYPTISEDEPLGTESTETATEIESSVIEDHTDLAIHDEAAADVIDATPVAEPAEAIDEQVAVEIEDGLPLAEAPNADEESLEVVADQDLNDDFDSYDRYDDWYYEDGLTEESWREEALATEAAVAEIENAMGQAESIESEVAHDDETVYIVEPAVDVVVDEPAVDLVVDEPGVDVVVDEPVVDIVAEPVDDSIDALVDVMEEALETLREEGLYLEEWAEPIDAVAGEVAPEVAGEVTLEVEDADTAAVEFDEEAIDTLIQERIADPAAVEFDEGAIDALIQQRIAAPAAVEYDEQAVDALIQQRIDELDVLDAADADDEAIGATPVEADPELQPEEEVQFIVAGPSAVTEDSPAEDLASEVVADPVDEVTAPDSELELVDNAEEAPLSDPASAEVATPETESPQGEPEDVKQAEAIRTIDLGNCTISIRSERPLDDFETLDMLLEAVYQLEAEMD